MLTDCIIEDNNPKEKIYRIWDKNGLYLEIMPNGSKLWRFKYRYAGKEKRLALGSYPEVSIDEARNNTLKARKLLRSFIDPSSHKKSIKEF